MSLSDLVVDSVTYKSYASLAEANAILNVDPVRRSTWNNLADDAKSIDLIAATNRLDLLPWQGEKAGGAAQEKRVAAHRAGLRRWRCCRLDCDSARSGASLRAPGGLRCVDPGASRAGHVCAEHRGGQSGLGDHQVFP